MTSASTLARRSCRSASSSALTLLADCREPVELFLVESAPFRLRNVHSFNAALDQLDSIFYRRIEEAHVLKSLRPRACPTLSR